MTRSEGGGPDDAGTTSRTSAKQQGVFDRDYRWLTIGILLTTGLVAFDSLGVATALPRIATQLGGVSTYGWAVSALMLASVVGTVISGHLADRHGPFSPFSLGLAVFAVGLVGSGIAVSWFGFLAGRLVQGLGVGTVMSMAYATIAHVYPPQLRGRAIALTSSAWMVPALVGPSVSAVLAETTGWRSIFFLALALTVVGSAITLGRLRQMVRSATGDQAAGGKRVHTTVLYSILLAISTGVLLAGLEQRSLQWFVPMVAIGAVVAVFSLRYVTPAGTLLGRRGVPAGIDTRAMICLAFFGCETFFPLAMTELRQRTLTEAGIGISAGALAWVVGSMVQAKQEARRGPSSRTGHTMLGFGLLVAGLVAVSVTLVTPALPVFIAIVGWAVGGLGMGFAYNASATETLDQSAVEAYGETSGTLQMAHTLSTALIAGIGTAVITAAHAMHTGLMLVFGLLILFALFGIPFASRITRSSPELSEVNPS